MIIPVGSSRVKVIPKLKPVEKKEPDEWKYCRREECRLHKHEMMDIQDGKQQCPVCGYVHNPFRHMTGPEINQWWMDNGR